MPARKKEKHHPFFCYVKQCRKTSWNTPEYLTLDDWNSLKEVVDILETNDVNGFWNYVYSPKSRDFFNRIIGWPEGYSYCRESKSYCDNIGFVMVRKILPKLKESYNAWIEQENEKP